MGNTWIPMLSGGLEVFSRLIFGYWLGRHSFMGIAAAEASAWISVSIMLGSSFLFCFGKFSGHKRRKTQQIQKHKNGFIKQENTK